MLCIAELFGVTWIQVTEDWLREFWRSRSKHHRADVVEVATSLATANALTRTCAMGLIDGSSIDLILTDMF